MIRTVKPKPDSLSTLTKKLDVQVSLFVRLEAADYRGIVSCISCGERMFWSDADCCHCFDRNNMATRYDLMNLAPGCRDCNRFDPIKHQAAFKNRIQSKYGMQAYSELEGRAHSFYKFTRPELEEFLESFKEKVATLKRQKGL